MKRPHVDPDKKLLTDGRRLFFTKDGDLDFGWVILIVCCLVGLGTFILDGMGVVRPSIAAWSWFGAFSTMAFIAGAAISRARLIAKSDAAAKVAGSLASVREPSIWTDDER